MASHVIHKQFFSWPPTEYTFGSLHLCLLCIKSLQLRETRPGKLQEKITGLMKKYIQMQRVQKFIFKSKIAMQARSIP